MLYNFLYKMFSLSIVFELKELKKNPNSSLLFKIAGQYLIQTFTPKVPTGQTDRQTAKRTEVAIKQLLK